MEICIKILLQTLIHIVSQVHLRILELGSAFLGYAELFFVAVKLAEAVIVCMNDVMVSVVLFFDHAVGVMALVVDREASA